MKKEVIALTPGCPGSLKYYSKLIPILANKYNFHFLLIANVKNYQNMPEMEKYCKESKYEYSIIYHPTVYSNNISFAKKQLSRNFFYSTWIFKNQFIKQLKMYGIAKIIHQNDMDIFIETKRLGIENLVMQWAVSYRSYEQKAQVKQTSKSKMKIISYYNFFKTIIPKIILYKNFQPLHRRGYADRYGVINEDGYNYYKNRLKIKENQIFVIGYLDFIKAEKIQNGHADKSLLLKKYGLDNGKKNITIYSTPFSTKDIKLFSIQEQEKYYKKISQSIRNIFNDEVNIALKTHPSEKKEMYSNLSKKLDVIIIGNDAINEELIYISDLYIAHHSTTNFIPLIYNKDCIFINFIKLKVVEGGKKIFGIKKFISDYDEFEKLLLDYKNGKLEKQYTGSEKIITKNSLEKIIDWIN